MKKVQSLTLAAFLASGSTARTITMNDNDIFGDVPVRCWVDYYYHRVQQDDTLEKIAKSYNHGSAYGNNMYYDARTYLPSVLARENGLKLTDTLKPGQLLKIPWRYVSGCKY